MSFTPRKDNLTHRHSLRKEDETSIYTYLYSCFEPQATDNDQVKQEKEMKKNILTNYQNNVLKYLYSDKYCRLCIEDIYILLPQLGISLLDLLNNISVDSQGNPYKISIKHEKAQRLYEGIVSMDPAKIGKIKAAIEDMVPQAVYHAFMKETKPIRRIFFYATSELVDQSCNPAIVFEENGGKSYFDRKNANYQFTAIPFSKIAFFSDLVGAPLHWSMCLPQKQTLFFQSYELDNMLDLFYVLTNEEQDSILQLLQLV